MLAAILRWRRVIASLVGISVLLAVVPKLVAKRTFVASASILPEERNSSNVAVAGLAAQLGVITQTDPSAGSPAFYETVLKSRAVLSRLVERRFSVPGTTDSTTLEAFIRAGARTGAARREQVLRYLADAVDASTDARTGIVTVRVRTIVPALSLQIVEQLVAELTRYNHERRRSHAANEREFDAARLNEVGVQLRAVEDTMQRFLEHNRGDVRQSPVLQFERDRISRDLALMSQTQATLAQALERARIDEARETPQFSMIELPETPVIPESRALLLRTLVGSGIGLFAGLWIALLLETARGASTRGEPVVAELQQLRHEARADLRRPLQWFDRFRNSRRSEDGRGAGSP